MSLDPNGLFDDDIELLRENNHHGRMVSPDGHCLNCLALGDHDVTSLGYEKKIILFAGLGVVLQDAKRTRVTISGERTHEAFALWPERGRKTGAL